MFYINLLSSLWSLNLLSVKTLIYPNESFSCSVYNIQSIFKNIFVKYCLHITSMVKRSFFFSCAIYSCPLKWKKALLKSVPSYSKEQIWGFGAEVRITWLWKVEMGIGTIFCILQLWSRGKGEGGVLGHIWEALDDFEWGVRIWLIFCFF